MIFHAPRTTKFTGGVGGISDSLLLSGATVKVIGITVQATANSQVVIEEANTSTIVMELSVLANTSTSMNIPFIADKGLQFTVPANCTCTVFHTQVL